MTNYFTNGFAHGSEKEQGMELITEPAIIVKAGFEDEYLAAYGKQSLPFNAWPNNCLILSFDDTATIGSASLWFFNHRGIGILMDYEVRSAQELEGKSTELLLQHRKRGIEPVGIHTQTNGHRLAPMVYATVRAYDLLVRKGKGQKSDTETNDDLEAIVEPKKIDGRHHPRVNQSSVPPYEQIMVEGKSYFLSMRAIEEFLEQSRKSKWDRRYLPSITKNLGLALENGAQQRTDDGVDYLSPRFRYTIAVDCITGISVI